MEGNWSPEVERECDALVRIVCDRGRKEADRHASWQKLLIRVVPFLERWAKKSAILRRCALATEDDARAVVVGAIERMSRSEFASLRRYLARAGADGAEVEETITIERVVRLTREPRDDEEAANDAESESEGTPLRAWLLGAIRFAAADHVRERLGHAGQGSARRKITKRDLGTDAARLDGLPEEGERPPMTDFLTLKRLVEQAKEAIAELPSPMREAFAMWVEDARFDDIKEKLALRDRDEARALARAAQARLRDRFRAEWAGIEGAAR